MCRALVAETLELTTFLKVVRQGTSELRRITDERGHGSGDAEMDELNRHQWVSRAAALESESESESESGGDGSRRWAGGAVGMRQDGTGYGTSWVDEVPASCGRGCDLGEWSAGDSKVALIYRHRIYVSVPYFYNVRTESCDGLIFPISISHG